ncbi:MAG: CinA family protein [Cellvibrionaceae bacterium]|nr:CinA family protein [Cellvibrionaceae bacterium]MCV6627607.1 CinA family protein [Cellvibrionaceae bacterium]
MTLPPSYSLAESLGQALSAQQLTLSTAESCTGGGIAAAITDVAGSSAWFERGFVTYANSAKVELLGVAPELLAAHGAVSQAVVEAMASGALQAAGAQLAVASSGIAGPGGGSPGKPVGTVWLGWAWSADSRIRLRSHCYQLEGERIQVRQQAIRLALEGCLALLPLG